MVYEAMLLFGIVFIAGWLFSTLLQQRHALNYRQGMLAWQFLIVGLYFTWFWCHGGQTLAMKTLRIRLSAADGTPLRFGRAAVRYLLCWMWFIPGMALAWALGNKHWMMAALPTLNIFLWAMTVYLDPQRQFLHDRLAGTRLSRVVQGPSAAGAAQSS